MVSKRAVIWAVRIAPVAVAAVFVGVVVMAERRRAANRTDPLVIEKLEATAPADLAVAAPPWIVEPKLEVISLRETGGAAESGPPEVPPEPPEWAESPFPERVEEIAPSFDPEEIAYRLSREQIVALKEELRLHNSELLQSADSFDEEVAAHFVEMIRREVPLDSDLAQIDSYYERLLQGLEWAAGLQGVKNEPTRWFRAEFLFRMLAGAGFPRGDKVRFELMLWGRILRALGCRMSEREERATCLAIRKVHIRSAVLGGKIVKPCDAILLESEGDDLLKAYRCSLLQALRVKELDALMWPEFQRAFTDNLSPENLESVRTFFAAFGVWEY